MGNEEGKGLPLVGKGLHASSGLYVFSWQKNCCQPKEKLTHEPT